MLSVSKLADLEAAQRLVLATSSRLLAPQGRSARAGWPTPCQLAFDGKREQAPDRLRARSAAAEGCGTPRRSPREQLGRGSRPDLAVEREKLRKVLRPVALRPGSASRQRGDPRPAREAGPASRMPGRGSPRPVAPGDARQLVKRLHLAASPAGRPAGRDRASVAGEALRGDRAALAAAERARRRLELARACRTRAGQGRLPPGASTSSPSGQGPRSTCAADRGAPLRGAASTSTVSTRCGLLAYERRVHRAVEARSRRRPRRRVPRTSVPAEELRDRERAGPKSLSGDRSGRSAAHDGGSQGARSRLEGRRPGRLPRGSPTTAGGSHARRRLAPCSSTSGRWRRRPRPPGPRATPALSLEPRMAEPPDQIVGPVDSLAEGAWLDLATSPGRTRVQQPPGRGLRWARRSTYTRIIITLQSYGKLISASIGVRP